MEPSQAGGFPPPSPNSFHSDGLPELVMGLTWMLWGGLLGIPEFLSLGEWRTPYWIAVPVLLAASGFASQWATKRLRTRWTSKRAGSGQALQPAHGKLWAVPLFSMLVAVIVAGFMTGDQGWANLVPLACAVLVAAGLAYGLGRQGVPGAAFYAALSVGLGIAIVRGRMSSEFGFALLWSCLGLAMTLGGLWRLARFLLSARSVRRRSAA